MATELTELVLTYQRLLASETEQDTHRRKELYRTLCDACRIIFYTYPVTVRVLQEEDAVELMLSMEGRLRHLIENFRYEHLPFEHYVRKVAYLQAHVFVRRRARELRRYQSVFRTIDEIEEEQVSSPDAFYRSGFQETALLDDELWGDDSKECELLRTQMLRSETFRNRLFHLVLLSADDLHAQQIGFLARFMHMDEEELAMHLTRAHEMSVQKRRRTWQMIDIRNAHYSAKLFYKQELRMLREINADPIRIERIARRLKRAEYHFNRSLENLHHRPNPVTHTVVADYMGVPKGTIDSGLHTIRRIIGQIMDGNG